MFENECDVFIAGSGVSGLYAAIILSKIGLNVHITDSNKNKINGGGDELLLFSPRSLQLLQRLDLLTAITQKGIRHWKFDVYHNKGYGNQALILEQQSIRLWENETTDYNYSISCSKSIVFDILKDYLDKAEGIQIDYKQELINIEENYSSVVGELALYYQYRPLPIPTQQQQHQHQQTENDRTIKSIYLKQVETENVTIWKSQAIIGADGQTSFVRQKLGLSLKNYENTTTTTRVFYTLQIDIVTTNFPGVRQISTISKKKDILYIIGHQTELYITFEHKPSWSKLSIDDEIPVNLAIRHIKSVMEPYQIEFGKVNSYNRWNGNNTNSCEEFNFESSYFFIGSAAQCLNPPGVFDINTNFEQVQNLCWKLALSLQHSASPKLLDTFEQETKQKTEEAMHVSTLFTNLIGDYYKHQEESKCNSLNASHSRDLIYQLRRFKNCFVGTTPFAPNILNNNNDDILSLPDVNSSTPSFEFVGPPPLSGNSSNNFFTSSLVNLATAGCLAPNAKLKPYTLFQLLLISSAQTTTTKPAITSTLSSSQQLATASSSSEEVNVSSSKKPPPTTLTISTKDLKKDRRKRSNSVTYSSSTSGGNNLSNIWSVLPIFQKSSMSSTAKKRASIAVNTVITSPTTTTTTTTTTTPVTTAAATTTTTPASVLISAERWKSIKTNHLQLLDCIQNNNKNACTFTILIFCGSINETQDKTRNFVKLLNSPISFLHRYERAHHHQHESSNNNNNRNSMISLSSPTTPTTTTTDHRSSISSMNSNAYHHAHKSSFEHPRRESFESFVDQTRFSSSSMSSASTYNNYHHHHHQQQPGSLFSILFVSNSTKSEAVKYLNNTPPATVHSTFPSGLTQVFLDHDGQCYKSYNIKQQQTEVVVIRPDGYIGTRVPIIQEEESFDRLSTYFDSFLRPPVDMNTAAAVVAAVYDC